MSAYRITNVRIFDGTGREPFAGEVLVDGPRIAAVTASGDARSRHDAAPPDATVIDGRGGMLMPGLVEAHAHLSFPDLFADAITRLPVEEHMLITVRNARTMLDCGYTSAFSAASAKTRLDVVLKREIEAARAPGPRLLANGPEITVTGGLGDTNALHLPYDEAPTFCWIANGPDDVRRVARTLAREGVDLLKLNISGDGGTSSAGADVTVMTDAEIEAAMEVARPRNLRVAGHCRSAGSVMAALAHGVEVIYHANYSDERALDALEAARDRIFVAPAIGHTWSLAEYGVSMGIPAKRAQAAADELAYCADTYSRMRKRGIRVLPGGDYGFPTSPHGAYAKDLELFVDLLGFSPMETLIAATHHGGEMMGKPGELGLVTAGALADLLLVDGDPLADITILQDRAKLSMIMKDGAIHAARRAHTA
ncbi:MAG: amidohydrolase family protein [Candidatus Rokubacteria bacterium]|nr:amidohydrolase family protein [Candidatus Rokubacteria bacterium]